MLKTISHDDNDDILEFDMEIVNVEFELKKTNDETYFIYVHFTEGGVFYDTMENRAPPSPSFAPIGVDEY